MDLPDAIGDGLYDIFVMDDANQWVLAAHDWNGASVFSFGAMGVDRFRVLGIETSANLNPGNTTAFITGLTFSRNGQFTGTQTPITVTVNDVPEPPVLALVVVAALAAGLGKRAWRSTEPGPVLQ